MHRHHYYNIADPITKCYKSDVMITNWLEDNVTRLEEKEGGEKVEDKPALLLLLEQQPLLQEPWTQHAEAAALQEGWPVAAEQVDSPVKK